MSQGLYSAIGGITCAQSKLDVISNNIANMNTVGFKSSNLNFQNLFSKTMGSGTAPSSSTGGTNPMQIGLGVTIGDITQNFTNGTIQSTGVSTDLNIQGNGFFAVRDGNGSVKLTRAGNFSLDSAGNLVNANGLFVVGTDRTTGASANPVNVKVPTGLKLSTVGDTNLVTTNIADANNCKITKGTFIVDITYDNAGTPTTDTKTFNIDPAGTPSVSTFAQLKSLVDSYYAGFAGDKPKVNLNVSPAGADGKLEFVTGDTGPGAVTSFKLTAGTSNFLSETGLASDTSAATTMTVPPATTIPAKSYTSNKVISYVTNIEPSDGSDKSATFSSFSIGTNGAIEATYSNGDKLTVVDSATGGKEFQFKSSAGVIVKNSKISVTGGAVEPANLQLELGNVVNTKGLISEGGNLFSVGPNAGTLTFSTGDANGLGKIKSGGLESSNVDLPTQFADMILAQRTVEANSQTFSTINQILQRITNLGR